MQVFGSARVARADDDPWFGQDKALHFTLSAAIAGGGYAAAVPFTDDRRWRLAVGGGLAIAAGAGKEISDRYDGGTRPGATSPGTSSAPRPAWGSRG